MASGVYKDGIMMDPKLPTAYRKSKEQAKNCANCAYLVGSKCGVWRGAQVRGAYICAKWKDRSEGPVKSFPKFEQDIPGAKATATSAKKKSTFSNRTGKRKPSPSRNGSGSKSTVGQKVQPPETSPAPQQVAPASRPESRPARSQQNRTSGGGGY